MHDLHYRIVNNKELEMSDKKEEQEAERFAKRMITKEKALSNSITESRDILKAHTRYLTERGINQTSADKIVRWLEYNKEKLANLHCDEILEAFKELLKKNIN